MDVIWFVAIIPSHIFYGAIKYIYTTILSYIVVMRLENVGLLHFLCTDFQTNFFTRILRNIWME
jgi:hypothetical protein